MFSIAQQIETTNNFSFQNKLVHNPGRDIASDTPDTPSDLARDDYLREEYRERALKDW